jgi:uncharacterized coiled-coil protein SlyX
MKSVALIGTLALCFNFMIIDEVLGQWSSLGQSSSLKGSSKMEAMKPLEKSAPGTPPSQTLDSQLALPPPKAASVRAEQATYFHPGILVSRNGRWEGSDHLLNVSNNIGVYVTFVKLANEALDLTETQIKQQIEKIFEKVNIRPGTMVAEGRPPLPVFEMEILLYPVERGYVACCNGRLFESVTLERFILGPDMAFQAITWEKQSLIVASKAQFIDQLQKSIQAIAEAFAERYQAFELLKKTAL